MKKIYIVGPDDILNKDFGIKMFPNHLEYIEFLEEKIAPKDALKIFVLPNKDKEWELFYKNITDTVIVEEY